MVEYSKVNVNLSNSQLHKLKTAAKNKKGKTLRMNIKMFNGNILQQDKKTKLRNTFENNMSAYIKFCKVQISIIIQSGRFAGSLLSKIEVPLMKVVAPLTKIFLALLGITAAVPTIICSDVTSQVGAFSREYFFKPLWRTMKNSGREVSG